MQCQDNEGGKAFAAGEMGGYRITNPCAGGFGGGGNREGGGGGVQVSVTGYEMDFFAGGRGSFVPNGDWTVVSGDCLKGNGFVTFEIMALDY